MTRLELHRYTYRCPRTGRQLTTRHRLTPDSAAQQLPAGATPLPETLEVRWIPDDPLYAMAPTGPGGVGAGAAGHLG